MHEEIMDDFVLFVCVMSSPHNYRVWAKSLDLTTAQNYSKCSRGIVYLAHNKYFKIFFQKN